jgi:hypothetical protein
VSQFVEECRREWKRLRVPSTIADEMANDLAADLEEAEADGATAEDVLGSGASDPRAFAAAWASERGIARTPWSDRLRKRWLLFLVAPVLLFLLVVAGGALALVSFSESSAPRAVTRVSPTQVVVGHIIGTGIFGAKVTPPNVALVEGRPTFLSRPPRSLTITFGNAGARAVAIVHLTVQVGSHTYRLTASHLVANSHRSVQIALPKNLPSKFKIFAATRLLPGEANADNNQRTWRIVIAK